MTKFIKYISVNSAADPLIPFVKDLYVSAFPQKERREWDLLAGMIGTVPEMRLQVIMEKEEPIGFMVTWKLKNWCFLEHFAISPAQRGKKHGENVMQDFIKDSRVLLEVEPPVSEDAQRRINFYRRVGLVCLSIPYLQPPYKKTGKPYDMVLMSNISDAGETGYAEIVNLIFEKVYGSPRRV